MNDTLIGLIDDFELEDVDVASVPLNIGTRLSYEDRTEDIRRFDPALWMDEVVLPFELLGAAQPADVNVKLLEPLERHIQRELFHLNVPWKWRAVGVLYPSWESRVEAFRIFRYLLHAYGIVPHTVDPSVEGGITLTYVHHASDRVLILEIYNGLEVAGVVSDSSQILYSEDIEDSRLDTILAVFRGGTSSPAHRQPAAA